MVDFKIRTQQEIMEICFGAATVWRYKTLWWLAEHTTQSQCLTLTKLASVCNIKCSGSFDIYKFGAIEYQGMSLYWYFQRWKHSQWFACSVIPPIVWHRWMWQTVIRKHLWRWDIKQKYTSKSIQFDGISHKGRQFQLFFPKIK